MQCATLMQPRVGANNVGDGGAKYYLAIRNYLKVVDGGCDGSPLGESKAFAVGVPV